MGKHSDFIAKLQEFQKESSRFQDKARQDADRLNKKIEFVQGQMQEELIHAVGGVATQISEVEKRILVQINQANEVMKLQGSEITKSIGDKEKSLNDTIQRGIEGVQTFVYGVTEELH